MKTANFNSAVRRAFLDQFPRAIYHQPFINYAELIKPPGLRRMGHNETTKKARGEPFGARAMMMGLATTEQIETALERQKNLADRGEKKLLGMIMVEMQVISTTQLLAILRTYDE